MAVHFFFKPLLFYGQQIVARKIIAMKLKPQDNSLMEKKQLLFSQSGDDSMGRRVHPYKRSVSWVNSVQRQFLGNGPVVEPRFIKQP